MNAIEFVKKEGLWVFEYALAQLSFNKDMFLVVYHYECEFVSEVKDNHGDCVFSYREVKKIIDAFKLVDKFGGYDSVLNMINNPTCFGDSNFEIKIKLNESINLVEQCNA